MLLARPRIRVSVHRYYHSHPQCKWSSGICTATKICLFPQRIPAPLQNPLSLSACSQRSFSIAASAAPTSGFLLVSLSKMTRISLIAAPHLYRAASFPIKASDHPEIVPHLLNLAGVQMQLREWAAAEIPINRALAIVEARLGETHPWRADAFKMLSEVYRETGRPAAGKHAMKHAESIISAYRRQNSLDDLVSIDELSRRRIR